MKNAALLLAIAAIAAVAALFLLSKGDTDAGTSRVEPTTVAPSGSGDDTAAPEDAPLADVAGATDRELGRSDARVERPEIPGENASFSDETSLAASTIVGRVTDGAGRPLAGADVVIDAPGRFGLSEFRFERGGVDGVRKTVRTGFDGTFTAKAVGSRVKLDVGLDGYAPLERTVDLQPDATRDVGDLRLAQGVRLRGRVLDSAGRGVADARILRKPKQEGGIVVYGTTGQPPIATTDDEGRFEIARQAAGPYEFDVVHARHPAGAFAGTTERAGEILEGLVVTLRDGAAIEGVVVGLPVDAPDDLRVHAVASATLEGGFMLPSRPGGPLRADVDDEGRFRLEGIEPGATMRLVLHEGRQRWDGSSRRARAILAEAGDQNARIEFSNGASVRFRVVDDAGEPIESVLVNAGFSYAMPRVRPGQDSPGGEVVVQNLWPDAAGETLRLEVDAEGFDEWKAEELVVRPEDRIDLGDVILTRRPKVVLTVASAVTGEPVPDAWVTMRPYRDPAARSLTMSRRVSVTANEDGGEEDTAIDIAGEVRGQTNEEGIVELEANPGATVEFLIKHPDHAETLDAPFAIPSSSTITEHRVDLAQGGAVRVTVVDPTGAPVAGARVERRSAEMTFEYGGNARRTATDDAGIVTFTGLPAGDEFFRLKPASLGGGGGFLVDVAVSRLAGEEDDGGDWTKVAVLPGETVDVTLGAPLRGRVTGVVRELGVPLAGASVTLRRPASGPMAGMMSFGPQGPKAVTDARGEFAFDDVEEGEYELVITHSTRAMEDVWPIEAEGAETEVEVELDVTVVEGVVYDENGDPVAGALVRARRKQPEGGRQQTVAMVMIADDGGGASIISSGGENANETRTNDEGRYSLRGVEPGVTLEVEATADGYDAARSDEFEVDAGATRDGIDVRFVKPGKVLVTIENGPGSGMVMLRRRGDFRAQPRIEPFTGASTTIDGVAPGDWTVRILGGANGEIRTDPDDVDVTVVGGETATATFVVR